MKTLKLFLTIFLAVFFANIFSHFATASLWVAGLSEALNSPSILTPAKPHSDGLQADIDRLNTNLPKPVKPDPALVEKQRALENDLRVCDFWRKQYMQDKLENSKTHMDSACKRASNH